MFSPRSSRGNVAIAALLMVVGVGALSLVAGSMHPSSNSAFIAASAPSTGTAQSPQPSSTTKVSASAQPTNISQECKVGQDYLIREDATEEKMDGRVVQTKRPKIYVTEDGRTVVPSTSSQCQSGRLSSLAGKQCLDQNGCRACSVQEWKCRVYYCKPEALLSVSEKRALEKSSQVPPCDLIGSCAAGQPCDMSAKRMEALQKTFGTISTDMGRYDTEATQLYKGTLPQAEQSIIDKALSENVQKQETSVQTASENYNQTLAELAACKEREGVCNEQERAQTVAQAKLDAEKQKLNSMREYAQNLATNKSVLAPTDTKTLYGPPLPDCNDINNSKYAVCNQNPTDPNKTNQTFQAPPPSRTNTNPFSNLGNLGQLMGIARQALGLFAAAQTPSCTIKANPTSITQAGQSVTLSWTSQYAQGGNLSNLGQVGPSGSTQVQPQQTTTYTLQVYGYPQQQQTPYGTSYGQPQGQYIWDPNLGANVYVQQQNSLFGAQNSLYGAQGALQQASCSTQVTIGAAATTTSQKPIAQLSCQPQVADIGMQVSLSFACQNAAAAGSSGFDANGQLAGSAQATVGSPTLGSNTVTYGLTCSKDGQVDSTQCTVEINKTAITLVANPGKVKAGEPTILGWVSAGMDSCTISSPTLSGFTSENAGNTSVSGTAKSPALTDSTDFVLNCITKSGGNRAATTTVIVGN